MKQGNGKCEHNIPLFEDNKCFLTWLLMLETASLQPCSSLVLLKVSVFPLFVSSEVFLASAGLQEADTLVLIIKENRNPKYSEGLTIIKYLDIALLLPAFPPSDKRRRCFLADWGVPPFCTRPPPAPPIPCTRPPLLFTCWLGEACWRRLGDDPGREGEFTRGADKYD